MNKNIIANIIKYIGIGYIVIGIAVFAWLGVSMKSPYIAGGGIAGSAIAGFLLIGFGEVISLLQQMVDKQSSMDSSMTKSFRDLEKTFVTRKVTTDNYESRGKVSASPSDHKFRCDSCNEMISSYPCEYCGSTK